MSILKAELSAGARETLRCLFFHGPTWDGNIPSKAGREELFEWDYAERVDGWTFLTIHGMRLALAADLAKQKEAWERRRV